MKVLKCSCGAELQTIKSYIHVLQNHVYCGKCDKVYKIKAIYEEIK